jgi:hypothetical protein
MVLIRNNTKISSHTSSYALRIGTTMAPPFRPSTILLSALMLSIVSLDVDASSCSCLSDAVSSISADSLAAAFCSQYVTTVWDSTTITTPLATTISTETVPALITITTTVLSVGSTVSVLFYWLTMVSGLIILCRQLPLRRRFLFHMYDSRILQLVVSLTSFCRFPQ